jgi:hypothetical protein
MQVAKQEKYQRDSGKVPSVESPLLRRLAMLM